MIVIAEVHVPRMFAAHGFVLMAIPLGLLVQLCVAYLGVAEIPGDGWNVPAIHIHAMALRYFSSVHFIYDLNRCVLA